MTQTAIASMSSSQTKQKQLLKAVLLAIAVFAVLALFSDPTFAATTGTEFQATSTKFSGLITGYYGKAVAFFALMIGAGYAAYKKDLGAMVAPIIITLGISIIIGIINTSFTAVI